MPDNKQDNITNDAPSPAAGDFEITIEDAAPATNAEPELAPVYQLKTNEQAYVREAVRAKFGDSEVERWFTRWIASVTSPEAYAMAEVAELIPPCFDWLIAYIDHPALARAWEDCCRLVFLEDSRGMVHVFAWQEVMNLNPASAKREG